MEPSQLQLMLQNAVAFTRKAVGNETPGSDVVVGPVAAALVAAILSGNRPVKDILLPSAP